MSLYFNFSPNLANRYFHGITLFFLVILLSFAGCRKKRIKNNLSHTTEATLEEYCMVVQGVECAVCAQHAIAAAESIAGVIKAYYRAPREDIAAGHLVCFAHAREFLQQLAQMQEALLPHALTIASVQGLFFYQGKWQQATLVIDTATQSTAITPLHKEQGVQEKVDNRS